MYQFTLIFWGSSSKNGGRFTKLEGYSRANRPFNTLSIHSEETKGFLQKKVYTTLALQGSPRLIVREVRHLEVNHSPEKL